MATKELRKPSLSKAIIRCYWKSYAVLGLFTFIEVSAWLFLCERNMWWFVKLGRLVRLGFWYGEASIVSLYRISGSH